MEISILDLYILSLLERGLETPYDLHRQGGISLGASTPALKRLAEGKLIRRLTGETANKRRSHRYSLTEVGLAQARRGWRRYFNELRVPADLKSLLRLVDVAVQYKLKQAQITAFLQQAARDRSDLAWQAGSRMLSLQQNPLSYAATRATCDYARLEAEAKALSKLAAASVMAGRRQGARLRKERKQPNNSRTLFDFPSMAAKKDD